ncbi:MAG TPA: 2-dehydro-3-deoxygalactonokinase, partial [Balneolaceae bacterium]|nr:2-dehydro-3-deoxygalactonokinase [Balneolaceae bacterium]
MDTDRNHSYMLSCDWGTSSFRLRLVDNQTGTVLQAITSRRGVKTISSAPSGEPFRNYLATQIAKIEERSAQPLAFVPVVISGMASSSIGWKELPYGSLPFLLDGSQLPIKQIPKAEEFPHDILLVSGICSSSDVMRGEETQMIGLAATHNLE